MSSVERRVVQMQFDNATFQRAADQTLRMLDSIDKKINALSAAKGLTDLGTAASKQASSLKGIETGVAGIASSFKGLGAVAVGALATIGAQAVLVGGQLVKSLTIEPLTKGFQEYETNLNSIQTILSNTQAAGKNLKDVTGALEELNHYSDQTIYNFSQMAKNIGTFTAAGVDLDTATASIKGIANLAALSGSNSEQASQAMYQLSQAISAGRVSLEDWNSVVNAGMGGTVFQRALAQTAENIGTLDAGAVKLSGSMKNVTIGGKSFRESITAKPGEESWLTSEVLTKTLAQFTGDLKDAELAAMGFNKEQIKAIQAQAATAKAAATEVKTFSQLVGTLGETAGSGWAKTWQIIFGDFEEAKSLFTNVNNVLGGFVSGMGDARNKILEDWKALGGRTVIIEAIGQAFKFLLSVVAPIGKAFREAFPATTGQTLYDMSVAIRNFTSGLSLSGKSAENLRRTFAGVFAVLGIGWDILKQVVLTIGRLVGVTFEGSGGFLEFTARIGDWLVKLREGINRGEGLEKVFRRIGDALEYPIKFIHILGEAFGRVFGADSDAQQVAKVAEELEPLGTVGDKIAAVWGKVAGVLGFVFGHIISFAGDVAEKVEGYMKRVSEAVGGLNFQDVLATLNTGAIIGIFTALLGVVNSFLGGGGGEGVMDKISDSIDALSGSLTAMQNSLRATTLIQIAGAILLLAIAMDKLAKIDAAGLARGSATIAVLFGELIGALLIFEHFSGFTGFAKMPFIALSMILMAAAINVLASAMEKISALSWEDIAKGLTGVTVLLAALTAAVTLMPNPIGLLATSAAIFVLSAAIGALAISVKSLGEMSWEEMAKGLVGVGVLIGALVAFAQLTTLNVKGIISGVVVLFLAAAIKTLASAMKDLSGLSWDEISRGLTTMAAGLAAITLALQFLPPSTLLNAVAIFVVAASLKLLADALGTMGDFSWEQIAKGLVTLAGALAIIAGALYLMSGALPGAASFAIVAVTLGLVADALLKMASMSWEEIGKSMVALAGSLAIIAGGLYLMSAALPGAAAMLVVAAALAVLAPVLVTLGGMEWEAIGKGLLALAGIFAVIGIAALLLTPVIPTITALAGAIALLGAAMLLGGVGMLAFGTGMTLLAAALAALAVSGVAGTAALVTMFAALMGLVPQIIRVVSIMIIAMAQALIDAVPKIVELIVVIILAIAEAIIKMAPKVVAALVVLLEELLAAIVRLTPKLVNAIVVILTEMLAAIVVMYPRFAMAGLQILTSILNIIAANIGRVVTAATNVAVAFIDGIGRNLPRIVDAGQKLIINFVNGLANAIRSNSAAMGAAGGNLASAIITGMASGLTAGLGTIAARARDVAMSALDAAKNALGINSPSKEFIKIGQFVNEGFLKGLQSGDKEKIASEFDKLENQTKESYANAVKAADEAQKKMNDIWNKQRWNTKALKEQSRVLDAAKKERDRLAKVQKFVLEDMVREEHKLLDLSDKYDIYTKKIEGANEALAAAMKTRDDYNKQLTEQFSDAKSATGEDTLKSYVNDLKKQVKDTQDFAVAIQSLRDLGINDEMYKDLLASGPSALPFIQELLAGGADYVSLINELGQELDIAGAGIGQSASEELYQAGVDAAQGLVDGLVRMQDEIQDQMDRIAQGMVDAIKKALGIQSPSKVFATVGSDSVKGMIVGLESSARSLETASAAVGDDAVEALRKSMSKMALITSDIETRPVITPVLDLSSIKKTSGQIDGMLASTGIRVGGSYSSAKNALIDAQNNRNAQLDASEATPAPGTTNYTQNNYSPKALSTSEIYRNTKNQLSTTREGLGA